MAARQRMDWRVDDLTQNSLIGTSHVDGINGIYVIAGLCDYFNVGNISEERSNSSF